MLRSLFLFLSLCSFLSASAQRGYDIEVEIDGYDGEFITLANNILDNQYLVDTAWRSDDGTYAFRSDTTLLPAGVYLVVLPPDNDYFQMVVGNDGDRQFKLTTKRSALAEATAEGSEENRLFFEYMTFLGEQQRAARSLQEILRDSTSTAEQRAQSEEQLAELNVGVLARQQRYVTEHPTSFVAAIVRSNTPIEPPAMTEITDEEERREKRWRYLQRHYFDNIDLKDERLLRTSFLVGQIDAYVDKLIIQHPDTMAAAVDYILGQMDPEGEMFKYYVIHFLGNAASSKVIGMDALYVHLLDNYYLNGKAYWTDEEQLRKFRETAGRLRPLLIGKKAPDITMQTRSGETVTLHGTEAKYTILYFWRYDCGSCKKSTPIMQAFYEKWKDRDVKLFSVCVKGQKEIPGCWEYIDENEIGDWLHTVDPYQRFYKAYDVTQTPSMFVLDRDKNIIIKRLSAEQLDEFLESYDASNI